MTGNETIDYIYIYCRYVEDIDNTHYGHKYGYLGESLRWLRRT